MYLYPFSTSTLDVVCGQSHASAVLLQERSSSSNCRGDWAAPGPAWTGVENSISVTHTGVLTPDRPACSESLYRLHDTDPRPIFRQVNLILQGPFQLTFHDWVSYVLLKPSQKIEFCRRGNCDVPLMFPLYYSDFNKTPEVLQKKSSVISHFMKFPSWFCSCVLSIGKYTVGRRQVNMTWAGL